MNRLIAGTHRAALTDLVRNARQSIWICSPWLKLEPVIRLIEVGSKKNWKVLARGTLEDFIRKVSDLEAFEHLVGIAEVRLARNLHAKAFIADGERALVGSANLTSAAEVMNLEFMVETDDSVVVPGLVSQLDNWFAQSRPIDRDWITAMRDRVRHLMPDTLHEPLRAHDLEGAWVVSPQPTHEPTSADDASEPAEGQDDTSKADSRFLYDDRQMPEEWKGVLARLIPGERTEPTAQLLPQLGKWVADIRAAIDSEDWNILHKRHVEGQTLEQIGKQMDRTRQRVEQIEARAGKRALEKASDSVAALLQWVKSLDSSVFIAVEVTPGQPEDLAIAVGVADKLLGRRLQIHTPSSRVRLISDKKRLETTAERVRNKSRHLMYSETNKAAEVLGVSADDLRSLAQIMPGLLFFTRDGRLGFRNWTMGHQFEAIACELAAAGFPEWHASQMGKAAAYVNPDHFGHMTPRDAIALVTRTPGQFDHMGRRGTYRVRGYGDGFRSTLEAIKSVFREHGRALHSRDVHALLQRNVPLSNVVASLDQNEALFQRVGAGVFEYLEGAEVQVPERDWLIEQCTTGNIHVLEDLRARARAAKLNEFRIHGLAATCPELELIPGRGKKPSAVRRRENSAIDT